MHVQLQTHAHTSADTCAYKCRHMHTQVQTHVHIKCAHMHIQVQTQGFTGHGKNKKQNKNKKHAFKHGHKCTLQRNRCIYV